MTLTRSTGPQLLVLAGLLLSPAVARAYVVQTASCGELSWDAADLPNPYFIDSSGSDDVPTSSVEAAFAAGWSAWEEPCCSDWQVSYQGRVSASAQDSSDSRNVISFEETQWPSTLGDGRSVLAVTLVMWSTNDCRIRSADMLFNGANHTWVVGGSGGADLQSVATHEQGHWLGLGHSPVADATMYAVYSGGTAPRTLHSDDEAGVCYLYPGTCSCTTAEDCTDPDEDCIDGACQRPPCTLDSDCDTGLICDAGDCIAPPCESDGDCGDNEICDAGVCRLDADCAICLPCTTADDCGGPPYLCTAVGVCSAFCGSSRDCPGDSRCFDVGGGVGLCLNPDAPSGVCPNDYVCTDACIDVTCPSGETCDPATGECHCTVCDTCTGDADCYGEPCLCWSGGCYCTPICETDGDCPDGSGCEALTLTSGEGIDVCLNHDYATSGACPSDFVCGEPADPCAGVSCSIGYVCNPATGLCESTGSGGDEDADAGSSGDTDADAGSSADADMGEDLDAGSTADASGDGPSDSIPDVWIDPFDASDGGGQDPPLDAGEDGFDAVPDATDDFGGDSSDDGFPDASSGANYPEPDAGSTDGGALGDLDAGVDGGDAAQRPPVAIGGAGSPVPAGCACQVSGTRSVGWQAALLAALLLILVQRRQPVPSRCRERHRIDSRGRRRY